MTFKEAFWLDKTPNGIPQTSTSPVNIQWLQPAYDSINNPEGWWINALDLSSLPPPHSTNTLLFYTFGDHVRVLIS